MYFKSDLLGEIAVQVLITNYILEFKKKKNASSNSKGIEIKLNTYFVLKNANRICTTINDDNDKSAVRKS